MSLQSPFSADAPPTAAQLNADAASRTRFQGLGRAGAISLARQDFHIERPSWTSPASGNGVQLGRYLGQHAVVEKLRDGKHAVLSSTIPLQADNGSGLAPTSLALHEAQGDYVPSNPVVPVTISKRASGGIAFPAGLSVTPVSAAAIEAPAVEGDSVMFANTAKDTDLIAEPRPSGAEMSWQLRSQESPRSQSLAFHLPPDAMLRWSASTPGGVEVVGSGHEILLVPPAVAHDAQGNVVPASYSLSGDILTTHVDLSGNVAFPVLVDPTLVFYGYYGTRNGANVWSGWQASAPQGYFGAEQSAGWYKIGTNPGAPVGSYGALTIAAPGPTGKSGSAGITRVDLTGVQHGEAGQSRLVSTINESNGPVPDYSWNGSGGASGPLPLYENNNLSNQPIAFCASGAGGHDGGEQPLCDEEHYQGHIFVLEDEITNSPQNHYNWVLMEGAQVTYRDPASPNKVVLSHPGYESQWLTTGPTNWKIESEDEGLGIARLELQIPAGHSPFFTQSSNCSSPNGFTGCPSSYTSEAINLSSLGTGAYSLAPVAVDAAENTSRPEASYVPLYIDKSAPVMGALTGSLEQAAGGVIGDGNYQLNFDPTDGSTSSPQSGVETVEIKVDGVHAYTDTTTCPTPKGVPASNCFDLSGSWTMNGETYGAGPHTITVIAKDWLGNESTSSFGVTVNEAAYESLGSGAVNLETGDYKLNPTDVSLSGGAATLSVSRTYDSRGLTRGASGPLGPQWMLNLPGSAAEEEWQSLTPLPEGSISVYNAHGEQLIFSPKTGGGYNSPAGYQTETLTAPKSGTYQLTDTSGDYTQFTQSSSGAPYTPSSVVQSSSQGELNKVKYTFTTKEGITEPTQVLGPEPSEGACTAKLVQGCRALTFNYATSTTATGEGPTEWGDYKGRLTRVYFTAWDPAKGAMSETMVAQYSYDTKGRLRAEWDPLVSPALKTTYGYDSEGHITAVSPPGQQPWLLHYGTAVGDASTGRLLSVSRPPAATALWTGAALKNTVAPTLSGISYLGSKLSVTKGTWTGGALAYSYQWEDCNASAGECTPIPGATNPLYTVTTADQGHTIVAQVSATNAGGTVSALTAPSESIVYVSQFGSWGSGNGQLSGPSGIARDSKGNLWVAETFNNRVQEFTEAGVYVTKFGSEGTGPGQFKSPTDIAIDPKGNVWVVDNGNNRLEEFNESGTYLKTVGSVGSGNGQFNGPSGLAFDAKGNLWVSDGSNNRVQEFNESGGFVKAFGTKGSGAGQMNDPSGVAVDSHGNLWIVDAINERIDVFNEKGEYSKEFGSEGTGNGQFKFPEGIAVDSQNNVWVSDAFNYRVEEFNEAGEYLTQFGSKGSGNGQLSGSLYGGAVGIVTDNTHDLWTAEYWNGRVERWLTPTPSEAMTPPSPEPQWTLEYHVPVSGGGAPYALGSNEVFAWAQKDDAVDATAIFPPDEAQTWPASDYKRATVYYMDSANRTVNIASPSGAISTTEYNKLNNSVERTLSADNREAALKEGAKSAEAAEALSSKSTYTTDGTELTSTLGPEHTVKLNNDTQVKARKHTQYFYDEGSPGGATYHLVTKTVEGAAVGGENEKDARTTTRSYSGQENLGWKLHAPTSSSTLVGGKEHVTTTKYEASTGNVTETDTPGINGYSSQFGSYGSGGGQFNVPWGIAIDSSKNIWVADILNNRIEELSSSGAFIKAVGWGVGKAGKSELEVCTSECKTGLSGTGNGEFNEPKGVAIDSSGHVWVADTSNNRIQEFSSAGAFMLKFGEKGSEEGKLEAPRALTVDSKGNVWVTDTANHRVEEFSSAGKFEKKIGSYGSGNGQFGEPKGIAIDLHGNIWVSDVGNHRIEEFKENGEYENQAGKAGKANGDLEEPMGLATDASGNVWVADNYNQRIEEFSSTGQFVTSYGSAGSGNGQFQEPLGVVVASSGDVLVVDAHNSRVQSFTPAGAPHGTQTIYYTTAANATYPECGKHPEWAGLACQGQPVRQPEVGAQPNLPVTTYKYNIWNEPLTTTDTVGSTTRTTTIGYDAAGRTLTSAISATTGMSLPTVTDEYNSETGALSKRSTTVEGKTKSVSSVENKLGQMTSYTDADGNTASYEYELEKDDRIVKVNDGKGTQTFSYNATTGEISSLKDSAAGTFTATRDVEGNITTEGYPNGMNANYTLNTAGEPINLEYVKTTHCSSGCTWYSDSVVPSIFSQWRAQTSSLSKQSYEYDEIGRLTEVQDTPAGKACTARLYAFDEDGNRASLASHECGVEGGTTETHTYDTVDRLLDSGVSYNAFGNITSLPAADAGGYGLTTAYYVNNTIATQEQNGEKISYNLDPTGRTRETISSGTSNSTVVSHYAEEGDSPAWTVNGSNWTRYISGIGGGLAAIQTNAETPVLQLADLHGDIVATAPLSETETKLLSTSDTTEYGVPRTTIPPKYSWLGSEQRPTELPTGIISMGARGYIPQLGRFEQTDPQPGGSVNAYAYTFDDPVNSSDPSGEFTSSVSYDESAASTGAAEAGLAQYYAGPGAITPPPVNMQIEAEFIAHLPWDAPVVQAAAGGGRLGRALRHGTRRLAGALHIAGGESAMEADYLHPFRPAHTNGCYPSGGDYVNGKPVSYGRHYEAYPNGRITGRYPGAGGIGGQVEGELQWGGGNKENFPETDFDG